MGSARASLPSALRPSEGGEAAEVDPLLLAAVALATVLLCGCALGAAGCLACRSCGGRSPADDDAEYDDGDAYNDGAARRWRPTRKAPLSSTLDALPGVARVLPRPQGGAGSSDGECWRL